jgi:hypothetical protein
MRLREKYADKATRDARFKELKARGMNVHRASIRNVQLHPMYVEDVPSGDTGFGNTDYMRYWAVLYTIEEDW